LKVKFFLSWPLLIQRGEIDFQRLKLRRDGRVEFNFKSEAKPLRMRARTLVILISLFFAGASVLMSSHADSAKSLGANSEGSGQRSTSGAEQQNATCNRLDVGHYLSISDAKNVQQFRILDFGGLIVGKIPSECGKRQKYLIRANGERYVIEKLIPQTQSSLRD
jgi:hypothetical protein